MSTLAIDNKMVQNQTLDQGDSISMLEAKHQSDIRSLCRVLQALFREGFLERKDLIQDGRISWLPLWSKQRMLRIEGLRFGRAGHCYFTGTISASNGKQGTRELRNGVELLDYLAPGS